LAVCALNEAFQLTRLPSTSV